MTGSAARLRVIDRAGLIVLCLLFLLSVAARILAYRSDDAVSAVQAQTVDLGEDLHLSRASAARRVLWIDRCAQPATADFVEASPHGRDASLAAPDNPEDRVAYVHRGQVLEGPRAAMMLSLFHFMGRAGALFNLNAAVARDELAVKLIVPASCEVPMGDVVDALRQDVRFWP